MSYQVNLRLWTTIFSLCVAVCVCVCLVSGLMAGLDVPQQGQPQMKIRTIQPDTITCTSRAVQVEHADLLQTTQVMAWDATGMSIDSADIEKQTARVIELIKKGVNSHGGSAKQIVKLCVYVIKDEYTPRVAEVLSKEFCDSLLPAVTYVTTPLPHPQALVAIDAIAPLHKVGQNEVKHLHGSIPTSDLRQADVSILPNGVRIYISGQAEAGATLSAATRSTLASLKKTLEHYGRTTRDIVQLKCFLTPMLECSEARKEIERFIGPDQLLPAISFIEWESTLPIEIELVASGGQSSLSGNNPAVEFLTPPGMSSSPVFSRVTRVSHPTQIYLGGLQGHPNSTGAEQVEKVFADLKAVLTEAGSDFHHLAKATYYVSQSDSSQKLNELRPKYYHPQSPPAASKAQVTGLGRPGIGLTLDMIAIPNQ